MLSFWHSDFGGNGSLWPTLLSSNFPLWDHDCGHAMPTFLPGHSVWAPHLALLFESSQSPLPIHMPDFHSSAHMSPPSQRGSLRVFNCPWTSPSIHRHLKCFPKASLTWLPLMNTLQQLPIICRIRPELLTHRRKVCRLPLPSLRPPNLDLTLCAFSTQNIHTLSSFSPG